MLRLFIMAYKGSYKVKYPHKYLGNPNNVVYRSLWERNVFRWLEEQPGIKGWCSEEVVIPYLCETDKKMHRYFIDVYFVTMDGDKYLIEIKPDRETRPPQGKKRSKRYLSEAMTYVKNQCKWNAAKEFAIDNGAVFQVWTEHDLKKLGIKTLSDNPRPRKKHK